MTTFARARTPQTIEPFKRKVDEGGHHLIKPPMPSKATQMMVMAGVMMIGFGVSQTHAEGQRLYGVALMPPAQLGGLSQSLVGALERQSDLRFRIVQYGDATHGLDLSRWWAQAFAADVIPARTAELRRLLDEAPPFVLQFGDNLPEWAAVPVAGYAEKGGVVLLYDTIKNDLPNPAASPVDRNAPCPWATAFERLVRERCRLPDNTRPQTQAQAGVAVPQNGAALVLAGDEKRHGQGETARVTATITLPAEAGPATLKWMVRDYRRGVIAVREEPLSTSTEPVVKTLDIPLLDAAEAAWVYWVQAMVERDGGTLTDAETPVYRWRRFDMREHLGFGTWTWGGATGDLPASFRPVAIDFLAAAGFNGLNEGHADRAVQEQAGFRSTVEHHGTIALGDAPVMSSATNLDARQRELRALGEARAKHYESPLWAIFSIGEETGYGNNWSAAYPWPGPAAPERPTFWFREYLKTRYADITALNASWGTAFAEWDEVQYLKRYAEPRGFLYYAPQRDVEDNLAPYVDHHAFAEFNIDAHRHAFMDGFQDVNPVMEWSLSFEFTFMDFSPAQATMFASVNDPHGTALWHAYSRVRTPGSPPFYHLNWAFYDDVPQTRQFWLQGLIAGATFMDNWGEAINWDLTHTRATRYLADLRAQVKPVANAILKMQPVDDERVGIFTQETPWKLVRGRPAYFTKGRAPEAVTYGPTIESFPCASWLVHPDGPLFSALTDAGYAPRFITPGEIPQCKIIFMPYVESLSADNARRLTGFVANGGILVALPKLAEYDERGRPFDHVPGAGLQALFGIRTGREWIGREAIVPLPGFDAAAALMLELYEPGRAMTAPQKTEVLAFDLPPSYGGAPMRLVSQAHVAVEPVMDDVKVLARHEDRTPALTWRRHGQGEAIFLNVLRSWPGELHVPADLYAATFARVLQTLVERAGVTPYAWFEDLGGPGHVAPQLVIYRYSWGGDSRILGVFNDWRSAHADTRLVFQEPVKAVYDLLAGKRLAVREHLGRSSVFVPVAPGDGALLACLPYEVESVEVAASAAAVMAGEAFDLTANIHVHGAPADRHPGQLTVIGPDGRELARAGRNLWLDGTPLRVPTYIDVPAGVYRYVVHDTASRIAGEAHVEVKPHPLRANVPAEFSPADCPHRRIAVSADELERVYTDLAGLYRDETVHPTLAYSFYVQEIDRSRHRLGQLLAMGDAEAHGVALRNLLKRGEQLLLLGEDCGLDPVSGEAAVPLTEPGAVLAAVRELLSDEKTRWHGVRELPNVLVLTYGAGRLVLDRRSPDREAGAGPTRMNQWIHDWRLQLDAAGLLPGQSADTSRLTEMRGTRELNDWFLQ